MSDRTYGISEIVGTSTDSLQGAVENAVAKASKTVRNLNWFEVTEIRGHIENDGIGYWQVGVKLGFHIED